MTYQITKKPNQQCEVQRYTDMTLEEMQALVGNGYIEIIHLKHYERKYRNSNYVLVVNDSGFIKNMGANIILEFSNTMIYGPLILLNLDNEGALKGLKEKEAREFIDFLKTRSIN